MFHDVAVKYEASNDFRIGERYDELGLTRFSISRGRNAEGVAKAVEVGGRTVDFCNQKSGLMNMKVKLAIVAGEHHRIRERLAGAASRCARVRADNREA